MSRVPVLVPVLPPCPCPHTRPIFVHFFFFVVVMVICYHDEVVVAVAVHVATYKYSLVKYKKRKKNKTYPGTNDETPFCRLGPFCVPIPVLVSSFGCGGGDHLMWCGGGGRTRSLS